MAVPKTKQAFALIDAGMTPYAAAKEVGLSPNTLYVAIRARREKAAKAAGLIPCPCCGVVSAPESLNQKVLLPEFRTSEAGC